MALQVLVNNRVITQATVGNNGIWSAQIMLSQPGQYTISVRGVLDDGVLLVSSVESVTVVVPTPAPTTATPTTPAPPTVTPTTSAPTATPLLIPTPVPNSLELVEPGDGDSGSGERRFVWRTEFAPPEGQAFELVFWRPGENPIVNGFGLAAPTTANGVSVNLSMLDDQLGAMFDPGEYRWGVLLVRVSPYERLQFLGASRVFNYFRNGGDDGSSSGGSSGGDQSSGE
jgi:hypothetical protein